MNKFDTLFLDRDGVINVKIKGGYVTTPNELEFMPGALLAIHKLTQIFKRIIIITNQQCIGKGIITNTELLNLHDYMLNEVRKNKGNIDKIYYCPHLISDKCQCRKPKAGMIVKALQEFPNIDVKYSYLIGDSDSDIAAGYSQGINTVKVDSKYTLFSWYSDLIRFI